MKILKKLFASKEVRAVLGILDEAECKFDSPAFEKIRKIIKNAILENTRNVIKQVREGHSPRQYVYSMIARSLGSDLHYSIMDMKKPNNRMKPTTNNYAV